MSQSKASTSTKQTKLTTNLKSTFAKLTPEKAYAGHNNNLDYGLSESDIDFSPGVAPNADSTFAKFCASDGALPSFYLGYFLRKMADHGRLKNSDIDPPLYPGLYQAYLYTVEAYGMKKGSAQIQDLYFLMRLLHASTDLGIRINDARFEVGKVVGRWSIVERLNTAGTANQGILLVEDKTRSNKLRAMKVLREDRKLAGREMRMQKRLSHANIVKVFDGELGGRFFEKSWIVMEFCAAGSLEELRGKYLNASRNLPEAFLWHALTSLLDIVCYLYEGPWNTKATWKPVAHRDMHPGNVFLCPSSDPAQVYPVLKLGDFGQCAFLCELRSGLLTKEELPRYTPREIDMDHQADDLLTVGRNLMESWTGHWLSKERCIEVLERSADYSQELANLLRLCFEEEQKRPTARLLLEKVQKAKLGLDEEHAALKPVALEF